MTGALGLVSHELRTPLTSILGHLELVLEDAGLSAENRHALVIVERNAHRLSRLVGDLLHCAEVEAGRFPLDAGEVDLAGVARAAVEAAGPAAGRADGAQLKVPRPAH